MSLFNSYLLPYIEDAETEPTKDAIVRGLEGFATSELKVILFVVNRLAAGRKIYGILNPKDGRDWLEEAAEEAADFLVYLSAHGQSL